MGADLRKILYDENAIFCELGAGLSDDRAVLERAPYANGAFLAEPGVQAAQDCPLMLTTSGSTGIPKVVALSAAGIDAFIDWSSRYFSIGDRTRVLNYSPLNFDLTLLEVWTPLAVGGCAIVCNPNRTADAHYLAALIDSAQPHIVQAVPMFFGLLSLGRASRQSAVPPFAPADIILTGDSVPLHTRKELAAAYPDACFHNIYGCTETNDSFAFTCSAAEVASIDTLPIGFPIDGTAYRVVGADGLDLAGAGEGLLHVSTPFLSHGYTRSALNEGVFYRRADQHGSLRYYVTGDRVRREADGSLYLRGRDDFVVKVRGVRTNLQDIERVILDYPHVTNAIVLGKPHEMYGSVLVAVIETEDDLPIDVFRLRTYCAENLPRTSIPTRFQIVDRPLPTTSTGKPDRKKVAVSLEI
jgi:acyl-coenzyme A synthetase/AMP-(fatty) acid ligase